jgi:hypothetical protein
MRQSIEARIEEKNLLANAKKTALYLVDALTNADYDSLKIELEELMYVTEKLEDLKQKRERRELLRNLVLDMRARGIEIDFATRSSFLANHAKNAVEGSQIKSHKDKKRQQA